MKSVNKEIKDVRTKDGNLRFGHIHKDQAKSSIMLQGQGGLEFITIDQTSPREGWIWFTWGGSILQISIVLLTASILAASMPMFYVSTVVGAVGALIVSQALWMWAPWLG